MDDTKYDIYKEYSEEELDLLRKAFDEYIQHINIFSIPQFASIEDIQKQHELIFKPKHTPFPTPDIPLPFYSDEYWKHSFYDDAFKLINREILLGNYPTITV